MNFFQKLFGNKKQETKKVPYATTGKTIRQAAGSYIPPIRRDEPIVTNDLLNPLNPLSPFWIGNTDNNDYGNSGNCAPVDDTPTSNDFGGGSFDGGGAGGDWSSPSTDSSSSYDSGSSSSYDSGSSSDSSSFDSGSSSGSDF